MSTLKKRKRIIRTGHKGTAVLVTVFAIALMSTLVIGILQVNTEEMLMMKNQVFAAQAQALAHAGLNRAFVQLRSDRNWDSGFSNVSFGGQGKYSVSVIDPCPDASSDLRVIATGTTDTGYTAKIEADITVSWDSPYRIRIDVMRINE